MKRILLILLYLLTLSYSQDHWETAIYANDEWSYLVPIEEPNSNPIGEL